jgi:mRNA-degrading endonuclease RelE of RelBE toxin-antitoxin system
LSFEIRLINAVRRDIRRLDKPVQQAIRIAENPYQASALRQDLRGLKSYHFSHRGTQYRIIYEIYQDETLVIILFIGPRENLYHQVRRRLQR